MENQFEYDEAEELRRKQWKEKIAEMKRQKERRLRFQQNIKKYAVYGCGTLLVFILLGVGIGISRPGEKEDKQQENSEVVDPAEESENVGNKGGQASGKEELEKPEPENSEPETPTSEETVPTVQEYISVGDMTFKTGYTAEFTDTTKVLGEEDIRSQYAVLIDAYNGTVMAEKNALTRMNPASMTKVLTVLVAAEHVTDLEEEFTITLEMTDYAFVNDCSAAGFMDGEVVTIRDLFYGTVLPSGGEAALALAIHVAGTHEAFVDMMNDKLAELGLADTAHFTNCVGLYDEEHYCTAYDMAMIMKAAVENDLCREVLYARKYNTSITEAHPEGILISNWFMRRIEDCDINGGEVLGAKTGYVDESGCCAASYAVSATGNPYICVAAKAGSNWQCIYDHVDLYSLYGK